MSTTIPSPIDSNDVQADNLDVKSVNKIVNFDFHGKSTEFFKIWIVNVLLTIVTLGIYSAWAKVRTNQYFYGNTELDGHRFSYLAKPLDILKGRIIAIVLFIGYASISSLYPVLSLFAAIILMLLTPFIVCSAMRFQLRMTSYRNVRFNFTGKYKDAFIAFIVFPFLGALTLGFAMPYAIARIDKFLINHTQYGNKQFSTNISAKQYYLVTLVTVGLSILIMCLFGLIMALFGSGFSELQNTTATAQSGFSFAILGLMAAYMLTLTIISAYYQTAIRNYVFNNSQLDDVAEFKSNFELSSYLNLLITNFLLLICTFGLAYPWTKIRKASYAVSRTDVLANDNKDHVIEKLSESSNATADEVANVFDVDIALT